MRRILWQSCLVIALAFTALGLSEPAIANVMLSECDGCGSGEAAECSGDNIDSFCGDGDGEGGICGNDDDRCGGGSCYICVD